MTKGWKRQSQEARDEVFRLITSTLNAILREMDLIGQYDHASFSVLLPRTTLQEGLIVAERFATVLTSLIRS